MSRECWLKSSLTFDFNFSILIYRSFSYLQSILFQFNHCTHATNYHLTVVTQKVILLLIELTQKCSLPSLCFVTQKTATYWLWPNSNINSEKNHNLCLWLLMINNLHMNFIFQFDLLCRLTKLNLLT